MTGAAVFTIAVLASSIPLLLSAVQHLSHGSALRSAISGQDAFHGKAVEVIMRVLPGVELTLGLAGLSIVFGTPPSRVAVPALMATVLLYGLFGAYGSALVARHTLAPCGCGTSSSPINFWVPARAFALALIASAATALAYFSAGAVSSPTSITATAVGLALAAALWILPESMHIPGRDSHPSKFHWLEELVEHAS